MEELMEQAREKGLLDFHEIVVLGGKHYVNRTKAYLIKENRSFSL
jgi:D-tyrosyl-tRNA(Tyr) deacylase